MVSFQPGLPEPRIPHQHATYSSTAKATLQVGAYGSGKTLTNAWIALRLACEHPGGLGLIAAETTPQLRETLQADFDTLISDLLERGLVTYNGDRRLYTFWNGSRILAWPLVGSNPKAMRHRIRSLNLAWVVIEEMTSIPKDTLQEVLGRLRSKVGPRQLYGSCNPDSPEHYLYDMFVANPLPGFVCIPSNTYNNPFLPPDYIRSLETSLTPEFAQRYLRGEWVNFEGLVYKEFRRTTPGGEPWHVIDPIPLEELKPVRRWGGLDFGGANPHVVLWLAEDAQGYRYVTREWFMPQVGLRELAEAITSDPVSPIYRDHDVADTLTLEREYRVRGLRPARKEKMRGIDTVSRHLRPAGEGLPPRLRIFSTCRNLIRELGTYKWPEGTDARDPGNEPVKKDDHTLDALRYALHSLDTEKARTAQGTLS
jgi:phage terminase large subunit